MRLIRERDDRVRMGMVDVPEGQDCMQNGLDRRIGRAGIDKQAALKHHHVVVGERLEIDHGLQRLQAYGRQTLRLDRPHIPSAAFDAEHAHLGAIHFFERGLDRGVSAAVQHQFRI